MQMEAMLPYRFVCIFLLGILSLQACRNQPADSKGSSSGVDSSVREGVPQQWMANMNEAYAQSVKVQQPILAYFTSSDTCGLCKQLEATVFSTSVFKAWAEKNVVLLEVDVSKDASITNANPEQNNAMVEYLKITSFPVVWLLNVTHEAENSRFKVKPIGYTGYQPSPEQFIGALQNFLRRE
jgi:protein disulfide-isomerase